MLLASVALTHSLMGQALGPVEQRDEGGGLEQRGSGAERERERGNLHSRPARILADLAVLATVKAQPSPPPHRIILAQSSTRAAAGGGQLGGRALLPRFYLSPASATANLTRWAVAILQPSSSSQR